jgi:hypothetical protein
MATTSHALTVGDTSIHSLDGLFSLNDLHRASGGATHHQPAKFLYLGSTKALIAELENSPNSESLANSGNSRSLESRPGRNGGTFACRELVIAYAAWISAAFHLKVIRVFLDVARAPGQATEAQRIKVAADAASKVAQDMFADTFAALLAGQDVTHRRWILAFITDSVCGVVPYVRSIPSETIVASMDELPKFVLGPCSASATNKELAAIAAACNQKLIQRLNTSSEKSLTPGATQ